MVDEQDDDRPDVALIDAELLWDDGIDGLPALVVSHQPEGRPFGSALASLVSSYDNSVGACFAGWREKTDAERLAQMLAWAWQAVWRDKTDMASMHAALVVIPEFRAAMTPDILPDRYRDEWLGRE